MMCCGLLIWLFLCLLSFVVFIIFFFFFQAEDGIRDVAVTGVQTCALPIFVRALDQIASLLEFNREKVSRRGVDALNVGARRLRRAVGDVVSPEVPAALIEIGRASCRERV